MLRKTEQLNIAITSGDADGIGLEVCLKALMAIGPLPKVCFFLFRSAQLSELESRLLTELKKSCSVATVSSLSEVELNSSAQIVEIVESTSPVSWVEESIKGCLAESFDGMVTAPLSKTLIQKQGLTDIGHTEIISRLAGNKNLFMTFLGSKFNVLLATSHIPLSRVQEELTCQRLIDAIFAAHQIQRETGNGDRPIGLVGLNPHAGEEGIIGREETEIFQEAIRYCRHSFGIDVEGPLVPDAAFSEENWSRYSIYVSPYHDQGLIPFKMIHGHGAGVHLTVGTQFVRTSVDHGTAKNIYGKNLANAESMTDAILTAIRLAKKRKKEAESDLEHGNFSRV